MSPLHFDAQIPDHEHHQHRADGDFGAGPFRDGDRDLPDGYSVSDRPECTPEATEHWRQNIMQTSYWDTDKDWMPLLTAEDTIQSSTVVQKGQNNYIKNQMSIDVYILPKQEE